MPRRYQTWVPKPACRLPNESGSSTPVRIRDALAILNLGHDARLQHHRHAGIRWQGTRTLDGLVSVVYLVHIELGANHGVALGTLNGFQANTLANTLYPAIAVLD
uniref:Uncharacterized protein n=1 Tax=Panagrolaimus superbus TaxID=310955 RepID=A0A914YS54_9BILA